MKQTTVGRGLTPAVKKIISLFLSLIMLISITTGIDFSSYASTFSGKNITWTLNTSIKTLTLSGTGDMYNYVLYEDTPPYRTYENSDLWKYYNEAENLVVEEGITSIGESAFMCNCFKKISLPNSLKKIGRWAFFDSSSYEKLTLPKSVQSIGKSAFYGNCLSEIIIPVSVKTIEDYAFVSYGKYNKKIVIPDSVQKIGNEAFGYYLDETKDTPYHALNKNTKIYGYSGTHAEKYAQANGIKFKALVIATLSTTSYTYNGKVKKPSVAVKDSKGNKIASSNYTVTYSNGRKNVGKYTVTIKFKGNYSGTVKKTFTIKPKSTTISKLTAGKKAFTVKWKKQATQATGYQIQYATDSKFTKNKKTVIISKNKATSKKITKLQVKKKYYVRVRTYKTVKVNGKNTKIYSSWSKAKIVKTK